MAALGFVLSLAAAAPVATGASPDGKRIAFVRDGDVWTMRADGSDAQDTRHAGSQPALFTDGQRIAYTGAGGVSVMFADGSGSTLIAAGGENPSWSPDGSRIAYDDGSSVLVRSADGTGSPATLDTGTEPAWSADGAKVAYVRGGDVYAIPAGGGTGVDLTNSSGADTEPQWSPDSARIAFVSTRDSALGELYTMTAGGAAQTRLTSDASTEASPSWAPDGGSIVFSLNDTGAPGAAEIYVIGAGGGAPGRLTSNTNADTAPDWGTAIANRTPPAVAADASGLFEDGRTVIVSSSAADWLTASPVTSFTYQWQHCTSGGSCTDVAGATGQSYQLGSGDVGATVRAVVTAHTVDGQAPAASNAVGPVSAAAPRNSVAPAITGTKSVAQTLTASTGTWLGTTPMTFGYRWRRCDAAGLNCTDIVGATLSTYKLADADAGLRIRVRVTATNAVGTSAPADSDPTEPILSDRPTNTVKPAIGGLPAAVGKSLSAITGTWTGNPFPLLTEQWQRCDAKGAGCVDIAGAASFFYLVADADAGSTLRLSVTGTNTVGATTAFSLPTNVIPAIPPANDAEPFISGSTSVGQVLSANVGTWAGTPPITYTFRWQRCDTSGSCTDIAGATSSSYVLTRADVGDTIVVYVTASNALGSATEASEATSVVTASGGGGGGTGKPPSSLTPPIVLGRLAKGGTLSATAGSWAGTRPLKYAYRWRRCTGASAACTAIPGATARTYRPQAADVRKTIRVAVTARNAAGSGVALSDATPAVAAKKGVADLLVRGTKRNDRLRGGAGNDMVLGKAGDDTLSGLGGADQLFGNAGKDTITGGAGADRIYGGDGNDAVNVAGGGRDTVDCGAGTDTVHADRTDTLLGCEKVVYAGT